MPLSAKSLAGPGYIILGGMRITNIISLLAVIAASIVMLVKIVITSKFFFFDAVSHVITACVSIFLIVSELSLFRTYFSRHWPLLSPSHGFVALGSAMLVLGVNTLGNLNKQATSEKNLGLPAWRIVIGSGCLIIIFGFFNILVSYIFRDRKLGVTARQVRAKGAVALAEQRQQRAVDSKTYTMSSVGSARSTDKTALTDQTPKSNYTPRPRTPENTDASPRRFIHLGRRPTLPSYHTSPVPSSKYSERGGDAQRPPMVISGPIGVNPQFQHLVRPDSAYHPARL